MLVEEARELAACHLASAFAERVRGSQRVPTRVKHRERRQTADVRLALEFQPVRQRTGRRLIHGLLCFRFQAAQHPRVDGRVRQDDRLQTMLPVDQTTVRVETDRVAVVLPVAVLHVGRVPLDDGLA